MLIILSIFISLKFRLRNIYQIEASLLERRNQYFYI
jgi:hypothetical protein